MPAAAGGALVAGAAVSDVLAAAACSRAREFSPVVFVVIALLSLVVEGVLVVCLWHPDTLRYLAGPWVDGPVGGPVDGPVDSAA